MSISIRSYFYDNSLKESIHKMSDVICHKRTRILFKLANATQSFGAVKKLRSHKVHNLTSARYIAFDGKEMENRVAQQN